MNVNIRSYSAGDFSSTQSPAGSRTQGFQNSLHSVSAIGAGVKASFSPEGLKLTIKEINTQDPESIRNFLEKFDFQNLRPKDLGSVASALFEKGAITSEQGFSLIGLDQAYADIDPSSIKRFNAIKVAEDKLKANIAGGPSAIAGRNDLVRALDFVKRLASFAKSDRASI